MADFSLSTSITYKEYQVTSMGYGATSIPDNSYAEPIVATFTFSYGVGDSQLLTDVKGNSESIWNSDTNTWTVSGTRVDINLILDALNYYADTTGNINDFTMTVDIKEDGNPTAIGDGTVSMDGEIFFDYNDPVNNPSFTTLPDNDYVYTPETPLDLDLGFVESNSNVMKLTIQIQDGFGADITNDSLGTLAANKVGNVQATYASGLLSFYATKAEFDTYLDNVTYIPPAGPSFSTVVQLEITADDRRNNNSPDTEYTSLWDGSNVVAATNTGATHTWTEDTVYSFNTGAKNIVVTDPTLDFLIYTVTLTLSDIGAGTLNTPTSGSVTSAFNAGVWTMTYSAQVTSDANVILEALQLTPSGDYELDFTIDVNIDDGGLNPLDDTLTMTAVPVDDGISATNMNTTHNWMEDSVYAFNTSAKNIVVTSVDIGETIVATWTFDTADNTPGDLSEPTSGTGTSSWTQGTGVWVATGLVDEVNAMLDAVTLTPTLNYDVDFNITTKVEDTAATLNGSMLMDVTQVDDDITADNMNGTMVYIPLQTQSGPNIVITSVDTGETVTATYTSSTNDNSFGDFNEPTSGAATATWTPGTGVWTVSGLQDDVNAVIAAAQFTYTADPGAATFTTKVEDAGSNVMGSYDMSYVAYSVADASASTPYTFGGLVAMPDLVIVDTSNRIVTATITSSFGDDTGGDLTEPSSGGTTSTWTPGTGVWTATGPVTEMNIILAALEHDNDGSVVNDFTYSTNITDIVTIFTDTVFTMTYTAFTTNDASDTFNSMVDVVTALDDIVITGDGGRIITATVTSSLGDATGGFLTTTTSGSTTSTWTGGTGVWAATGPVTEVNAVLAAMEHDGDGATVTDFTYSTDMDDSITSITTTVYTMEYVAFTVSANITDTFTYTVNTLSDMPDIVITNGDDRNIVVTLTSSTGDNSMGDFNEPTSGSATSSWTTGTGVWTASGTTTELNAILTLLDFTPVTDTVVAFNMSNLVDDTITEETGTWTITSFVPLVDASNFIATTNYLSKTLARASCPNFSKGTFNAWFRQDVAGDTLFSYQDTTYGLVQIHIGTYMSLTVEERGSSTAKISWVSDDVVIAGWNNIVLAWDATLATPIVKMVLNNVVQTPSGGPNNQLSTVAPDVSETNGIFRVANTTYYANDPFDGDLAEVLIDNNYTDISILANYRKYITASGEPEFLGAAGTVPTGSDPLMYFRGDSSSFGTNRGTMGSFTTAGGLSNSINEPVEL